MGGTYLSVRKFVTGKNNGVFIEIASTSDLKLYKRRLFWAFHSIDVQTGALLVKLFQRKLSRRTERYLQLSTLPVFKYSCFYIFILYLKLTFFVKVLDIRSFIHVSTWMQSHLMVNDDEAEDDNIVWTWERKATLMVATQYRIEIFPSKVLLRLWEYLLHNQTIVSRYNLRIWILYHKYIFLCMIQKIKIKNLGIKKNTNPWLCLLEKSNNWVINISTS